MLVACAFYRRNLRRDYLCSPADILVQYTHRLHLRWNLNTTIRRLLNMLKRFQKTISSCKGKWLILPFRVWHRLEHERFGCQSIQLCGPKRIRRIPFPKNIPEIRIRGGLWWHGVAKTIDTCDTSISFSSFTSISNLSSSRIKQTCLRKIEEIGGCVLEVAGGNHLAALQELPA